MARNASPLQPASHRWGVVAELLLTGLTCTGAVLCYHLVRMPLYIGSVPVRDVACVERRARYQFPPGSTLECSRYGVSSNHYLLAVVHSPGPPPNNLPAGPSFEYHTPTTLYGWPRIRSLPEPETLGVEGEPICATPIDIWDGSDVERTDLWMFYDADRDETVTYLHWSKG